MMGFAGVVARVVVAKSPKGDPSQDIESLPLTLSGLSLLGVAFAI